MLRNLTKSIFFKIFGLYLVIIFLMGLAVFMLSFNLIKNYYIETLSNNLINIGTTLKPQILPLIKNKQADRLENLITNLDKNIDTRITITDENGVVLADSESNPKLMVNHKGRPEINKALSGETGKSLRMSGTVKQEMLYIALPVKYNEKIIGVLRLSLFTSHINTLIGKLKIKIFHSILVIILISLIIAFLFTSNISRPIKELVRASNKVAKGNFDAKIFLKENNEFKEVAESFNYMTGEIKSLFADLSRQKEELNTIFSSIHGGIIVLDNNDKILMSNENFNLLANNVSVAGKFIWEIIRSPEFNEIVKKVRKEKRNITEEVELNSKYFICVATPLSERDEIIVILHDITEVNNIETIKKDFVANVSHELKTPITTIKGFVETIMESGNSPDKRYLEIILRNVDRLAMIVQDLLTLSKLEEKGIQPEFPKVDIKEVLYSVTKIFEKQIKAKNLSLFLELAQNLSKIKGDQFKLEQLFMNLLDNSIKYTEKGEIRIAVKQSDKVVKIEVSDTGIGIPKEHLYRIFERFYVVDKSRSRKLGGTGLGLSIVKHIVLLHSGTIEVESIINQGTKFTINLPI